MTPYEQQLAAVTEWIVKTVGTTLWSEHRYDDEGFCFNCGEAIGAKELGACRRPITLADTCYVLMLAGFHFAYNHNFIFHILSKDRTNLGSCRFDPALSLDKQSPETIAFLSSLIS